MTDTRNIEKERGPKTGEVVAAHFRRRIATGELAVGDRLPPEDELMDEFGVARTTLREGLRILESQGLIAVRRGRNGGGEVIAPALDRLAQGLALHLQLRHVSVGDLDEARQLIEPPMAGRLARSRRPEDLAALAEAIERAAAAAGADDRQAFGSAATALHELIVERGGNETLSTLSRLLHELVRQYYRRSVGHTHAGMMERAVRSYRKLYRLVESGDAEGAEDHWRRQMTFTASRQSRTEPLELF